MILGKLPVPGRPTIRMIVGQGPIIVLAVGAGGGCLDIFTLLFLFSSLSPSLWETARYRLKYYLKGPLNPKTTNQPTNQIVITVLCLMFIISRCYIFSCYIGYYQQRPRIILLGDKIDGPQVYTSQFICSQTCRYWK